MNPEYEAHERLCKSIGDMAKENEDLKQHVTELENRLRALWDKLEGERKYYEDRIKRLEDYGNALVAHVYAYRTQRQWTEESYHDLIQTIADWDKAKASKP